MAKFIGAALLAASLLAGCAANDLSKPPTPIGDFRLGYDIVVADSAEPAGPSRKATPDEWEAALKKAIDADIGRYQGDKLYHLGVAVERLCAGRAGHPGRAVAKVGRSS
jgi:hypothetical protein